MLNLDIHMLVHALRGDLTLREHDLTAATSLVHGVPLVTRDKQIRKSKRVPVA